MITIRPATSADIPAITRIYGQSVVAATASFELEPPSEAEMASRMAVLLKGNFPYLVAEIEGAVAGYAYAGFYRTRLAYRFTVENSVYVDPKAQQRGVGRTLLDVLIAECTKRGFRQMIAVIGDSPNQTGSIALHTAAGFKRVGVLENVGFKHGQWRDSLLMQLMLGDGAASDPV